MIPTDALYIGAAHVQNRYRAVPLPHGIDPVADDGRCVAVYRLAAPHSSALEIVRTYLGESLADAISYARQFGSIKSISVLRIVRGNAYEIAETTISEGIP
jgi:hypothetical protein